MASTGILGGIWIWPAEALGAGCATSVLEFVGEAERVRPLAGPAAAMEISLSGARFGSVKVGAGARVTDVREGASATDDRGGLAMMGESAAVPRTFDSQTLPPDTMAKTSSPAGSAQRGWIRTWERKRLRPERFSCIACLETLEMEREMPLPLLDDWSAGRVPLLGLSVDLTGSSGYPLDAAGTGIVTRSKPRHTF
jgi:hypothetical protein